MSPLPVPLGILGSTQFSTQYIASNVGSGYGSAVTSLSGNTYVQSYGTTYKLNKFGRAQWARTTSSGNKNAIAIDSSENVYVAGSGSAVVKYDSSGNLIWQRVVGTGVSWQDCKELSGSLYLTGSDGTYGHITKIDTATGATIAFSKRLSGLSPQAIDVSASYLAVSGIISNGTGWDTRLFVMSPSTASINWQKNLSISNPNGVFCAGLSIKSDSTSIVVSGHINSPNQANYIVSFNASSGATVFSIKGSSSVALSESAGSVSYGKSDYLYMSSYATYTGSGFSQNWGTSFFRFAPGASAPEAKYSIAGTVGALRLQAGKSTDHVLGIMGTSQFIKINGLTPPTLKAYGSYTLQNLTDYTFVSSGISISNSGDAFGNSGFTSVAGNASTASPANQPTNKYLR